MWGFTFTKSLSHPSRLCRILVISMMEYSWKHVGILSAIMQNHCAHSLMCVRVACIACYYHLFNRLFKNAVCAPLVRMKYITISFVMQWPSSYIIHYVEIWTGKHLRQYIQFDYLKQTKQLFKQFEQQWYFRAIRTSSRTDSAIFQAFERAVKHAIFWMNERAEVKHKRAWTNMNITNQNPVISDVPFCSSCFEPHCNWFNGCIQATRFQSVWTTFNQPGPELPKKEVTSPFPEIEYDLVWILVGTIATS